MKTDNSFRKAWFLVLLLALLAGLNPVSGESAQDVPALKQFNLLISGRQLRREGNTIRVTQGDAVELTWNSDEAVKLHLHGYDIEFAVSPDEPTVIRFDAHATGRFPVTSHGFGTEQGHGHEVLLYVEVYPD